jgi:hypothetical protein
MACSATGSLSIIFENVRTMRSRAASRSVLRSLAVGSSEIVREPT